MPFFTNREIDEENIIVVIDERKFVGVRTTNDECLPEKSGFLEALEKVIGTTTFLTL